MNSRPTELLLHLSPSDPEPVREQIARQLRDRIVRGELGEGTVLPGHRRLARQHRTTPASVEAAYGMLIAEDLLTGEPAAGPRVASLPPERRRDLTERITRGAPGLFLDPKAFAREKDTMHWCPLPRKGACTSFFDWLYHKECVANRHPVFEGLPGPGIMDWDYYGPIIPREMFEGLDTPEEAIAAGFATGSFNYPDGYGAGLLIAAYRLGAGRVILSTPRLLANLDAHPAADRLLVNLIAYARRSVL